MSHLPTGSSTSPSSGPLKALRSQVLLRRAAVAILLCVVPCAWAGELAGVGDPVRARSDYMLNCQGCHGPSGEGNETAEVPRMQGFVGKFLTVEGGREFMVQVPGSANTALADSALAEVLNWMLLTMSADEVPANFVPYDAVEVGRLRQTPETNVLGRRAALIEAMGRKRISTH